jgi:hypothetical protein
MPMSVLVGAEWFLSRSGYRGIFVMLAVTIALPLYSSYGWSTYQTPAALSPEAGWP